MSKSDLPKLVTALFTFKGKNNDELCFKKGDLIIITQTDDGGWWEGTLNDKTGWFPSNYVKEYKPPESGHSSTKSSPEKTNQELPVYQRLNRDIVLRDLVDSERASVAELQSFVNTFLEQLALSNILKKEEYKQLSGNIHEVLETHQKFLTNLEAAVTQGPDSKVGNLFLTVAPKLKSVHMTYCNGHPQAVCILDKYRDELNEFMERSGAVSPGILVLTSGLSKPFRRLEKYAPMLQELERYTGKNHSDRGDTQRSVCVYREIAERCTSIRKQRELALQILTSGIKGWEGEELSSLGEILYVGPVTVVVGAERRDRYFVLFPMNLLVLSTSPRMSSFIYEGKLPLTGINVIPIDDTEDMKNVFEISGPMIEKIVVLCAHKEERHQWIELLTQDKSSSLLKSPTISNMSNQIGKLQPQLPESCSSPRNKSPWSLASLRPAPPIYLKAFNKSDNVELCRSPRAANERQFEDDAIILKIIEGYCMTVNARLTVHSAALDNESSNKMCDSVSVVNNKVGNLDSCNDRSLSQTVETLKNQVGSLQSQVIQLTKQLDDEKQSRLLLTVAMKRIGAIDNFVS
ncbi:rho guanine nucleotide exchange factor 7 isoform X1 [Microplitis demolitor]|uniref:rho guanine nucleotide exchange factor 7 isoform X1 n=1 Tax=Microplitis demolitor TaxID=69319 RepID=UPI0006D4CB6D|nr:rho guanine nucleotide exchange factor 7 isoform X1 [Microplitis demolitor]